MVAQGKLSIMLKCLVIFRGKRIMDLKVMLRNLYFSKNKIARMGYTTKTHLENIETLLKYSTYFSIVH